LFGNFETFAVEERQDLAGLRGIVWVGAGLFLFGLATLFYPPLRVVIGSVE
jgi:hypothetical protein